MHYQHPKLLYFRLLNYFFVVLSISDLYQVILWRNAPLHPLITKQKSESEILNHPFMRSCTLYCSCSDQRTNLHDDGH